MEDLIKVAANGQWKLEKAKQVDPKLQQMIAEYMANKNKPAEPRKPQASGLKPVEHNTGANPNYSKEQVAAIRAGIAPDVVAAAAPKPTPQVKHAAKVTADIDAGQAEADEKAKTSQGRKAAWEAGVAFLAQHGNKGYQALQAQMQQRKVLDQAHETGKLPVAPKPELLPPQKQGSFHNESAETAGKIVSKPFGYPDKETGEMRYGRQPRQERHHWAWDHNNKKWNHMKTTLGNPNLK